MSFLRPASAAAFAFSAALLLPVASRAQQSPDVLASVRAAGVIRIANTQASPPWSMLDTKNEPAGYDVEVAKEVARRIGVPKVQFVSDLFKNFVAGLKAGKYDLVMNDLTPTKERMQQVDFSEPYGVEDFRIFVRDNNESIKAPADLANHRVGVTAGTSNESWTRANVKGANIVTYDNGSLVFNDLAFGRVDAVISSHFGGVKYAVFNNLPIREVGPILTYQLSAAAMVKGQAPLRQAVDKAVTDMIQDGTIDRIAKQWVNVQYKMSGAIAAARKEQGV